MTRPTKLLRSVDLAVIKSQIAALTNGRTPVSNDRRYLMTRLAELRRGVRVPTKRDDKSSRSLPVTISIGTNRRALLDRMCQKFGQGSSAIMRRALDEFAVKHGFGADVERITRADRKAVRP